MNYPWNCFDFDEASLELCLHLLYLPHHLLRHLLHHLLHLLLCFLVEILTLLFAHFRRRAYLWLVLSRRAKAPPLSLLLSDCVRELIYSGF